MGVPFGDLKAQYAAIKDELDNAIGAVIAETAFVRGKYVAEFEASFAAKCEVEHCISCANGTDAIYITLRALGVGPGDEVITVANSWISTSETISQTGAKPVFVDIDPDYFHIDAAKIEEKVTSRTKAVIPVHLYGQPVEIEQIKNICDAHGLHLVEDCAQAHFATSEGQKVGTFGQAGTFSFYPGKNLGAFGDAGAIITNDGELASKVRMFANHGSLKKHEHVIEGINSRMDGIQAAVLSTKLRYIDEWNKRRFENALLYNELLSDIGDLTAPAIRQDCSHIFHLYVIKTKYRDSLKDHLQASGIATGIHYPCALPYLKAYEYLNHTPADFPIAHQLQQEILSLPMYPELSSDDIRLVSKRVHEFFDVHAKHRKTTTLKSPVI